MQIEKPTIGDKFINDHVITTFKGSKNHHLSLAIYNLQGQMMFATNLFCEEHSIANINEINNKIKMDPESQLLYSQIIELQQDVVQNQHEICYLLLANTDDQNHDYRLVRHWPVFMPDGNAAGSIELRYPKNIMLQNFTHLITNNRDYNILQKINNKPNIANFNLTRRQHEILFLLSCGIGQAEIAQLLNI